MQLSLYTLVTQDFSLEESIAMAAQAGFDAIDIRQAEDGIHVPLDVGDEEITNIRGLVADAGLHVSGLTTYWEMGIPDPQAAAEHQAGLRRGCEIARLLGARFVRCSAADLDFELGYEQHREVFREQFEQANEMAAEFDLTITVEQHSGGMCASAGQILDLTRGLPTDHIGIVYDPGNCWVEGFERVPNQIEMLRNLINAVHIKNMTTGPAEGPQAVIPYRCAPLDSGFLDWPDIIARIKGIGFADYLTLEELVLHPRFSSVQEMIDWDVAYLRGLM